MSMYVSIVCDNCHKPFMQDRYWTPDFVMHQNRHECPGCRILHGEDVTEQLKNYELKIVRVKSLENINTI